MNKGRRVAYRRLKCGSRYHAGEISALTIGQKRTSTLSDLRGDFDKLKKKAEYHTKERIEYFATWVHDWKEERVNRKGEVLPEGWRRHAHVIWTSRETDFHVLVKWLEDSAGKPMSLFIDRNVEQTPWKLVYALQYNAMKQGESVRYAMSEGWLPQGCEEMWREIRDRGMNIPFSDSICDLNSWIDLQRVKHRDRSRQTLLRLDDGTRVTPHSPEGKPPVLLEKPARFAFVKRRLKNVWGDNHSHSVYTK